LYFQMVKFQQVALNVIKDLRLDSYKNLQKLGLKYFDDTASGAIVSRITNDTEAIKDMFIQVLVSVIQGSFLVFGIYGAMFVLNPKLALICLLALPIIFMIVFLYNRFSTPVYLNMREKLSDLNTKISESVAGMKIIQIFRQEARKVKEFEDTNEQHYRTSIKMVKLDSLLLGPAIDVVYLLAIILVISYFGWSSFVSPIEVGLVYVFLNYLNRLFSPINHIMQQLPLYQQAIVASFRVFALMDENTYEPTQKDVHTTISDASIEFKNVSFSYDGKRDVLKNINFKVEEGQTVALVGQTGSGKSSIINLMLRFYEFERGDILIGGKSIKEYSYDELRKQIGLVLQDPFLFHGTIKDNIRLYNKDMTEEEWIHAAKLVHAHEFIEQLEGKYDAPVVEKGSTLSSGQRQLIAFARTVATNPKIIVLDEATANIDTQTEELITDSLNQMRKGRTTIAIAHRLSTIVDADLILVLQNGEIIESGTHQQLLEKKGTYYTMYLLQNSSN